MPRRKRDPFEVKLTPQEREKLELRLCEEIDAAFDARIEIVGRDQRIDQWHKMYEGGDRGITKNSPWPGAANLNSWIGTEKVDAFRARVVKTLFAEPIWIVSGWSGSDQEQLSKVEAFHQWAAEEERLQTRLSKVVHNALIEGTGVLEVSERPVLRKQRQRIRALVQTTSEGKPIADENGRLQPEVGPDGMPMQAPEGTPDEMTTPVVLDNTMKVRSGPQYRVLSLQDFAMLPGHAQEREDVWGYAKRFWKRVPDLLTMEQAGVYENVDAIGEEDEREEDAATLREGQRIAPQRGPTAEKELFELTFLDDLDRDGVQEWYIATLSVKHKKLLRLQRDDLGQSRYLIWVPFPRTRFVYGYSLIGHKLDSIIEEHTAWRNMIADRVNLVINAPIKRRVGSMWNPTAVPWGPHAIMDVQDMGEVEAMVIPDLPSSVVHREGSVLSAAERVAGMNDAASGVTPNSDRTKGEVELVHGESMIRVEEVVKHLQESMEDLFNVRHEIWKRTLREQPLDMPKDLMVSMENRGLMTTSRLLQVGDLEGTFRGKPRGSVETADYSVLRQDYIGLMTALTQFSQAVPTFGVLFQDPELGKALLSQAIRIFRWENREAFETALQKATQKAQQIMASGGALGPAGAPPDNPAGTPRKPQTTPGPPKAPNNSGPNGGQPSPNRATLNQ